MKSVVEAADLDRFRGIITSRFGLNFDDSRVPFLEDMLRQRVEAFGRGSADYLAALELNASKQREWRALAQELTVGETYFFRNPDQFRALAGAALPARLKTQSKTRTLRILSAGCASGEEAYSIAILLRASIPDTENWRVFIHGIDVNPAMVEKATRARYSAWSLRETPEDSRERWFHRDGRDFILDDRIRTLVTFEEANLADDSWTDSSLGCYDIIFCRNVIMYFTPAHQRTVVAKLARGLAPGGFLFLGHAETLRALSHDFHLRHTHDAFYYQRKDLLGTVSREIGISCDGRHAVSMSGLAEQPGILALDAGDAWVEAIRRASERVHQLADAQDKTTSPAGGGPFTLSARRSAWDLGLAMDLLRRERFADALAFMRELPVESESDPDVLLLLAVLLIHNGELPDAERVCARLLRLDEMNAGAHYLTALCAESAGDLSRAMNHDQVASYLEPGFAMPHLHYGLLARKSGNFSTASREFRQAFALLQREDVSRLLFFGGGFSREALLAICTSEIAACGDVQ